MTRLAVIVDKLLKLFQQPVRIFAVALGLIDVGLVNARHRMPELGLAMAAVLTRVVSLPFNRPKIETTDLKTEDTTL